jgi:FkbM family methyltransferase
MKLQQLELKNGLKINAISNDLITTRIIENGIYEPLLYEFLCSYLSQIPRANCIDIGANIGNHTLTMSKYSNKVYAFEPVPSTFNILKKNISVNNIDNVIVYQLGLSSRKRKANIEICDRSNVGTASIVNNANENSAGLEIDLVTGDSLFNQGANTPIDFIKIDVEGHETEALLGLKETIEKFHPTVVVEWNNDRTKQAFKENRILETLFKDYSLFKITNNYDAFRIWLGSRPYLKPISSIARVVYKLFVKEFFCLSPSPNLSKNHESLLLIKPDKLALINKFLF